MMTISADFEIDSFEDILQHTAQIILNQHQDFLPDLQSIKVIVPNGNVGEYFRIQLLAQLPSSFNGIIPPWTGTLKNYLANLSLNTGKNARIISDEARRLLFIETLDNYPNLYKNENKWQVTSSLLALFDELYLANPDLLNLTEEQWLNTLKQAYKVGHDIKSLRDEATLIQKLWLAWQEQLGANGLIDATREYVKKLTLIEKEINNDFLYIVTATNYSPAECVFIEKIKAANRCSVVQYHNDIQKNAPPAYGFVNSTFDIQTTLKERLKNVSLDESEIHFSLLPANSDESEASAVDLQIRKWLLAGKTRIGIVCENRKLSRRIRALLERADIYLRDLSGWSLATTSAAAVLESWLQCIEEDFDHRALLDLLKSHFFLPESDRDFHDQAVYRLEHDIILHENISSNITRYKNQLKYRAKKLGHWPAKTYSHVEQLLDNLDENAKQLSDLFQSKQKHHLSTYIDGLLVSLEQLGMMHSFSNDDAGKTILECLSDMKNALVHSDPEMLWSDFRLWLGINMESRLFIPDVESSPVSLLTLKQSELMRFDGLIIAAADKQHFPGTAANSPFFNQGVRATLGLTGWEMNYETRLNQFKKLLFSSDTILITYKCEDKGEAVPLSPWVAALQNNFHLISGKTLFDENLMNELTSDTSVTTGDEGELPQKTTQPSTAIPDNLIPSRFSARSHQSIIDCPYMYFAEDALSLKPPEEISDELQKSDYGRLIHRVLQAFHLASNEKPVPEKLQPFGEKLTQNNKKQAIDHLVQISEQLFKRDLENNALHKSWLHRWIKQIPSYIDWQIKHQENWDVTATEQELSIELDNNKILFGRIDRVDNDADEKCIIDYKTGVSASQETVDKAEDVQLVTYALLDDEVKNVFYLSLDDSKRGVRQGASLSGETLQTLKASCSQRLNEIIKMTHDGYSLTAWGDDKVCSYCKFDGICRKPFWSEK